MIAQITRLRRPHAVVVVPDDSLLFGRTYQPRCLEYHAVRNLFGEDVQVPCYRGPFVSSESRAREIGVEHTAKANGSWGPAW